MSALTEPHTNGHNRELNGVRTYRGRKLEDLIPQIRAELGPDAIILRQREGLMGGVGGFFAQKCVEVDAQAGGGRESHQKIDIYDEDEPASGWDEGLAGVLGQQAGVARDAGLVAHGLDDRAEVADRDALREERLQHTLDLAERENIGHNLRNDSFVDFL